MPETDLPVFCDRAGNAEALKSDSDCGSSFRGFLCALFQGNSSADRISPNGIFKADRLGFADDFITVDSGVQCNLFAFFNGGDAVFGEDRVDFVNASLIIFKKCYSSYPPSITARADQYI